MYSDRFTQHRYGKAQFGGIKRFRVKSGKADGTEAIWCSINMQECGQKNLTIMERDGNNVKCKITPSDHELSGYAPEHGQCNMCKESGHLVST